MQNYYKNPHQTNYRKRFRLGKLLQPHKLVRQLTRKLTRKRRLEKYIFDFGLQPPGQADEMSRSSSPRFIVDRQGAVCWPPFKIGEGDNYESDLEHSEDLGIENFTLKKPQPDNSTEAPCVLGWLQVG